MTTTTKRSFSIKQKQSPHRKLHRRNLCHRKSLLQQFSYKERRCAPLTEFSEESRPETSTTVLWVRQVINLHLNLHAFAPKCHYSDKGFQPLKIFGGETLLGRVISILYYHRIPQAFHCFTNVQYYRNHDCYDKTTITWALAHTPTFNRRNLFTCQPCKKEILIQFQDRSSSQTRHSTITRSIGICHKKFTATKPSTEVSHTDKVSTHILDFGFAQEGNEAGTWWVRLLIWGWWRWRRWSQSCQNSITNLMIVSHLTTFWIYSEKSEQFISTTIPNIGLQHGFQSTELRKDFLTNGQVRWEARHLVSGMKVAWKGIWSGREDTHERRRIVWFEGLTPVRICGLAAENAVQA